MNESRSNPQTFRAHSGPSTSSAHAPARKSRSGVRARMRDSEAVGYLEICLFAFLFIVIFSTIARADVTSIDVAHPTTAAAKKSSLKNLKNKISRPSAIRTQTAGKTVAQNQLRLARQSHLAQTTALDAQPQAATFQNASQTQAQASTARVKSTTPDDDSGSNSAYGTSSGVQIFGTTLNSRISRKRTEGNAPANPSNWSFVGGFTTEGLRSLNPTEKASYSGSYTVLAGAIYKPWGLSLSGDFGFSQEYSYAQENDGRSSAFDNPVFRLQKTYVNKRDFNSVLLDDIRLIVTGSLPANRAAGRQSFEGSIGPSINFDKKVWRLNFTQGAGYARGFYEYDMDAAGNINSPDVFKSISLVSLNLTDSVAWSNSFLYLYAIDFQKVGKATQIFTSSLDVYWTGIFSTSIGLLTNRGTLDADGRTNRILLFDQDGSYAFLDLGWRI